MIKFADIEIDEATRHLASLDRELADLQRQLRRGLDPAAAKVVKADAALVRERRDIARMELLELVTLAEMPSDVMGRA